MSSHLHFLNKIFLCEQSDDCVWVHTGVIAHNVRAQIALCMPRHVAFHLRHALDEALAADGAKIVAFPERPAGEDG